MAVRLPNSEVGLSSRFVLIILQALSLPGGPSKHLAHSEQLTENAGIVGMSSTS